MNRFIFPTSTENEDYCLEIAQAMTIFFGITLGDAIARINKQWGNVSFGDSELLYHEPPDYWAKFIFLGDDFGRIAPSIANSLSRVERKLNLIMDHLGLDYRGVPDHVLALLRAGRRLDAITLYQKETGLDLKQAKEVIDRLAAHGNN